MYFPSLSPHSAQITPEPANQKNGANPISESEALPEAWQRGALPNPPKEEQPHQHRAFESLRVWWTAHWNAWERLLGLGHKQKSDSARSLASKGAAFPALPVQNLPVNQQALALVQSFRAQVSARSARNPTGHSDPSLTKKETKAEKKAKKEAEKIEYLPRALTRPVTVDEISFNPHLEIQEKENRRILAQSKFWDTENLIDPFHEMEVDEQE